MKASLNEARNRHAQHYCEILIRAEEMYRAGDDNVVTGLALFDLEWPHIILGQAWATTQMQNNPEAARLCNRFANGAAQYRQALKNHRGISNREGVASHLGDLGSIHFKQGDLE